MKSKSPFDISDFYDTEIVDVLSGALDFKLVVNLKPPDRSGVVLNTNNTNITETPTSFNKFKPSKNDNIDSKTTESM